MQVCRLARDVVAHDIGDPCTSYCSCLTGCSSKCDCASKCIWTSMHLESHHLVVRVLVSMCVHACVCVRVYVYVCVDGVHVIGPGVSGQAQAEAQPAVCSQ